MPFPVAAAAITGGSMLGTWLGNRQQAALREHDLQRILALFNPEGISGDTSKLFDAFRSSPMYSGLRTRAMVGSSTLGNQLQTSFARRGLGTSGIAGAALPLARSSFMSQFQDIDTDLWAKALQSILSGRGSQSSALSGFNSTSPAGQAFGSSLKDLMPYLRTLMPNKAPGGGA